MRFCVSENVYHESLSLDCKSVNECLHYSCATARGELRFGGGLALRAATYGRRGTIPAVYISSFSYTRNDLPSDLAQSRIGFRR